MAWTMEQLDDLLAGSAPVDGLLERAKVVAGMTAALATTPRRRPLPMKGEPGPQQPHERAGCWAQVVHGLADHAARTRTAR
jgi:hypothetical protein